MKIPVNIRYIFRRWPKQETRFCVGNEWQGPVWFHEKIRDHLNKNSPIQYLQIVWISNVVHWLNCWLYSCLSLPWHGDWWWLIPHWITIVTWNVPRLIKKHSWFMILIGDKHRPIASEILRSFCDEILRFILSEQTHHHHFFYCERTQSVHHYLIQSTMIHQKQINQPSQVKRKGEMSQQARW